MSILPISNVINVTVTNTPSGLTEKNVNSLALFTHETPNNLDAYGVYVNASQVAEDYGSDSLTAQMANAIFAQSPNIITGDGRLVIIPLDQSAPATAGTMTTADLTANLNDITAVTDGDLKVNINGVAHNLTALNLSQATTWSDVAELLQARLLDVVVTATGNGISMSSKKVGDDSTVTLAAVAGGTGTNLAAVGYFSSGTTVNVSGDDATGETLLAAITRTAGAVGYVGVLTTLDLEDDAVQAVADGIQALDRMFFHSFSCSQDIAGIINDITDASDKKTRCLLHLDSVATARLMRAAYAGRGCSVNFDGNSTAQTMNLKELATIEPDTLITQTLWAAAEAAGADLYVSYDGVPSVVSNGANDYFDNQYANLALKFALETAGFNFLRQTTTKVPQTEKGMNGLKAAYAAVMEQYVTNGCFAPGAWTSSDRFGDPETFDKNIANSGYYIYSLPIAKQQATDRNQRKAPLTQIAGKRAGAIHSGDVLVIVND